jgi:hypothetical protein
MFKLSAVALLLGVNAFQPSGNPQERAKGRQIMSYWPTTMRVDTDMSNSWLDQEERACTSSPEDRTGSIYWILCSGPDRSSLRNIPVTFYGDTTRGVQSDWKCRKSTFLGETRFACYAVK